MSKKDLPFLQNVGKVAGSRLVSLIASIAGGLLLPQILSVEGYGYYKIYTLYIAYTALLHFGFPDGILLRYAGTEFCNLDARRMRGMTVFFLCFQALIGIALSASSLLVKIHEYAFIIRMLGLNLIVINITTYYQFLSQATQRFSEYSSRYILSSVLKILLLALLLLQKKVYQVPVEFQSYVIGINIIDGLMLVWYLYTYRTITFGVRDAIRTLAPEIKQLFQAGIVLTVAYQVGHLVFALDRQFVSLLFPTETYAVYSFAYTLIGMVSTMISSISVVLLPMLKKSGTAYLKEHYVGLQMMTASIAGLSLTGFYLLSAFLKWYLPKYAGSVTYLRIVMPALMLTCCISVVMFTCFKVLDIIKSYFVCSVLALVIGIAANMAAYTIFHSPEAISYASVITMVIWFAICDLRIRKYVPVQTFRVLLYILLLIGAFYGSYALSKSVWTGMLIYFICFCMIFPAFCGKPLRALYFRKET